MRHRISTPTRLSRRTLLKAAGQGTTLAALASALGCSTPATLESPRITGSTCLTILYRNDPDVMFDFDYYRDRHMARIMRLYGTDAVRRFELRTVIADEGAAAPYIAAINIWIRDAAAFADVRCRLIRLEAALR